ncbi:unnamed protein product [Boreogadus saida]
MCLVGAALVGSQPSFALSTMFTFAAFCYMLSLVLCASLIFFAIWHSQPGALPGESRSLRSAADCGGPPPPPPRAPGQRGGAGAISLSPLTPQTEVQVAKLPLASAFPSGSSGAPQPRGAAERQRTSGSAAPGGRAGPPGPLSSVLCPLALAGPGGPARGHLLQSGVFTGSTAPPSLSDDSHRELCAHRLATPLLHLERSEARGLPNEGVQR